MADNPYIPAGVHFGYGFNSGRGLQSPGLEAMSERWNQLAQAAGTAPHSVLNQLSPSPVASNLSAPSQRDRLLPNGYVLNNTRNGAAEPTAQTDNYLQMSGGSY